MILYDTKKWWATLFKTVAGFKFGSNYRRLLAFTLSMSLYAGVLLALERAGVYHLMKLNTVVFSLIGVIISLTLVFRLNTSYNKWWEGRQQWGRLVNVSRSLAGTVRAVLAQEDVADRTYFANHISNFAYALRNHLRSSVENETYLIADPAEQDLIAKAIHQPNVISKLLHQKTENLIKGAKIDRMDKITIAPMINDLTDILGACERIKNTPIPFSHSSFIKISLLVYLIILPFGLLESFGWIMIPVVAVMTFSLVGIEIISEEIEDPFGKDPNDLPLTHLSGLIRRDVHLALDVDIKPTDIPSAVVAFKRYSVTQ